jgi:hypothetical protein
VARVGQWTARQVANILERAAEENIRLAHIVDKRPSPSRH